MTNIMKAKNNEARNEPRNKKMYKLIIDYIYNT